MYKYLLVAGIAGMTLLGGAVAQAAPPQIGAAGPAVAAAQTNIVATAISAGQFKTLVKAVQAAGLAKTLSGPGPFTVFAPTDAAFAKLPKGALAGLLKDKKKLTDVLTYHVVSGKMMASEVVKAGALKSLEGKELKITDANGEARVNGVRIVKTDIVCSNGVIHVIDAVLMPK